MAHNTFPEVRPPWLRDGLLESGLPIYDLRIDPDDLKVLQDTAERVTAIGHSRDVVREYVDADFLLDGKWVPIKVKLRGYTSQHYRKRIASFRLNFPNEQLFRGKEQVNLSATYDKGLTADITANWELSRYGILTWEDEFVVLRVNGELAAMYQETEQFDRSISDRHRRAEGFIFAGHGQLYGPQGLGFSKATEALELLKPCYVDRGAEIPEHCDWEFFEEYFDIDKMAWAAAMTVVLNSYHAWIDDNLRFFWDPARGKFEPIPWDYLYYAIEPDIHVEGELVEFGYRQSMNSTPEFRRLRDQRVWILLNERLNEMIAYADSVFDDIKIALSYDLRHLGLATDVEKHEGYKQILRNNREILKQLYEKQEITVSTWHGPDDSLVVEFANYGKSFVEIDGISLTAGGRPFSSSYEAPLIVDGLWQGEPGRLVVEIPVSSSPSDWTGVWASNGVTGAEILAESVVLNELEGAPAGYQPTSEEFVADTFELDIDGVSVEGTEVLFGPGTVALTESVTIPKHYDVVFRPGLDLRVGDAVSLVIHGDLDSRGTATDPIRIHGLSSDETWGGVFVQGTRTNPSVVKVEHTSVMGGLGGESKRSFFTSPFSVHDGIVTMRNSTFSDAIADDGINLKYAQVDIESVTIIRSASDSLDCDFCKGTITETLVMDSGGDGLDFSGSNVTLVRNNIQTCADKGISIGEATVADVGGTMVSNCYIGTGVKDSSFAEIHGGQFDNVDVGVAMYIKKHTYGPAEATIRDLSMSNVSTRYLHDGQGKLTILTPDRFDKVVADADPSGNIVVN